VREYLMRVGEHWLRQGIDGWRLDVPFEIETPGFWKEFRQRCRAINPNAYLVGEIWRDSRRWLQGDQFDATMNYLFAEAALAFCGRDRVRKEFQDDRSYDPWPGIDGTTYAAKIDHLLGLYDWNVQLAQLNLLDSHDTARALTLLGDDRRSLELATLLLFTFPGAPSIYYGDEIGLDGGLPDQWARKTFPWQQPERWDHDLHGHYKRLVALRSDSPAFRTGTYQALAATAGSYAFGRALGTEQFIVALNTSDSADRIELGDPRIDGAPLLTVGDAPRLEQQASTLSLDLPARSGVIYRAPLVPNASSEA
ncbi:MAG: alpha-amylase family glycosyl hydrolase, partial [Chloroflexota bacterium]|nr:alpha-amylase family glycosyl hydrolase [Chloroflexota bacterium]